MKIHKVVVEDDSLYEVGSNFRALANLNFTLVNFQITVPAKNFDEDVLTPGLHVEVTSDSDTRLWASVRPPKFITCKLALRFTGMAQIKVVIPVYERSKIKGLWAITRVSAHRLFTLCLEIAP